MKIISIVGTRPQFLKLAPLDKYLINHNINHIIIHTHQHYDKELSNDIFLTLGMRNPDYILKNNNYSGVKRFSNMMEQLEIILLKEKPNKVIVYGDCDTTVVGAISTNIMKIPLIHIESGMRSYNKKMPEEINRIITDNISNILLCSTMDAVLKLNKENIKTNVRYVGNLQFELLKQTCDSYNNKKILKDNSLNENEFSLLTIHRDYNTNKKSLVLIFNQLEKLDIKIIFPIHPRTKKVINNNNISIPKNIILVKPINYLDMTILQRYCKFIITDSGGIQPEAWFLKKKCIVLRTETEWYEPLETNNNILYDYKTPLDLFIKNFLDVPIINNNFNSNVSENIYKILKEE